MSLVCQFRVYILNTHIWIGTQYTYIWIGTSWIHIWIGTSWIHISELVVYMCIEDVFRCVYWGCTNSDMCFVCQFRYVYSGCTLWIGTQDSLQITTFQSNKRKSSSPMTQNPYTFLLMSLQTKYTLSTQTQHTFNKHTHSFNTLHIPIDSKTHVY